MSENKEFIPQPEIDLDLFYNQAQIRLNRFEIKPEEFKDLYGVQIIEQDKKEVENLEAEFKKLTIKNLLIP